MADIFLKLEGIHGESLDHKHHGEIEIADFLWGLTNNASFALTQQDAANNAKVDNVIVTKYFDKSSVTLAQFCATGQHIPEGRITCRKNSGDAKLDYLLIVLKKVMVTDIKWAGKEVAPGAPETVKLSFLQFKLFYTAQESSGASGHVNEFGFDVGTHKPI
jgi:type VI secretion system secreted protein Hcp